MPAILDVAIGLIFTYLLFSLIVSATKEVLSSFMASSWDARAKMLGEGIGELFHTSVGQGFTAKFYSHPLIGALSPKGKNALPNYIPRETFVATVLDLLVPATGGALRSDKDLIAGIIALGAVGLRETIAGLLKEIRHFTPDHPAIGEALAVLDLVVPAVGATQDANTPAGKLKKALEAIKLKLENIRDSASVGELADRDFAHTNWNKAKTDLDQAEAGRKPAAIIEKLQKALDDTEEELKKKEKKLTDVVKPYEDLIEGLATVLPFLDQSVASTPTAESPSVFHRILIRFAGSIAPAGCLVIPAPSEDSNTKLQRTLLCLWQEAGGDIDKFKEGVGAWFDRSMDRVTGWYKKHSQKVLLAVAMFFAITCNVDTLRIVDALSTDPKLREEIVLRATQYVNKTSQGSGQKFKDAQERLKQAEEAAAIETGQKKTDADATVAELKKDVDAARTAWNADLAKAVKAEAEARSRANADRADANAKREAAEKDAGTDASARKKLEKEADDAKSKAAESEKSANEKKQELEVVKLQSSPAPTDQLKNAVREMNGFGLPIGWTDKIWNETWAGSNFTSGRVLPKGIFYWPGATAWKAICGWLITALAASLGAPFWFDTLNKIITIRSGGRAPEEKDPGENGTKDDTKKSDEIGKTAKA